QEVDRSPDHLSVKDSVETEPSDIVDIGSFQGRFENKGHEEVIHETRHQFIQFSANDHRDRKANHAILLQKCNKLTPHWSPPVHIRLNTPAYGVNSPLWYGFSCSICPPMSDFHFLRKASDSQRQRGLPT